MAPQREWFEKDYYKVLGLSKGATEKEITRAYRKRMLRDQTAHLERATEGLIEQLLPVLDAFELALLNAGTDPDRLRKGVELVYSELLGVLEKSGLERIDAHGKPFDPAEHEAVMHVEGGEPGVLDVIRTGYRLKGRVLRPAMVKVAT